MLAINTQGTILASIFKALKSMYTTKYATFTIYILKIKPEDLFLLLSPYFFIHAIKLRFMEGLAIQPQSDQQHAGVRAK